MNSYYPSDEEGIDDRYIECSTWGEDRYASKFCAICNKAFCKDCYIKYTKKVQRQRLCRMCRKDINKK